MEGLNPKKIKILKVTDRLKHRKEGANFKYEKCEFF